MGLLLSLPKLRDQWYPPRTEFSADNIPDLSGKVIIVTGSNTGIGKETAKQCLVHNAKVYLAARNKEKAEKAILEIKNETGKEGIWLNLDLADLKSVKAAAEEFLSKETQLHVLFNNAGVMFPPHNELTAQGIDLQWGTNLLGHYYFTTLLMPALLAAATATGEGRVVNTASAAVEFVNQIDFNTLKDTRKRKQTTNWTLYAQSKMGNVLFSNELARRYGGQGIVSTALDPGAINTDLPRHLGFLQKFTKYVLSPVSFGALTQLYAGTSPEGSGLNGKYLIPWARVGVPNKAALDSKLAEEVWKWCEEQTRNI